MTATREHYGFPTVDEILAQPGRLGDAQRAQFAATAEIRFDDERYGAFRPRPLTASPHDWRFSQDSSERALAAHALAVYGIGGVDLHRREAPDFSCSVSGSQPFGLEVAELHRPDHAAFENNTTTITLGVLDALDEPDRSARTAGVMCELALRVSPKSADARRIRDELVEWIDTDLAATPDGTVTFDPVRYKLLVQHRTSCTLIRSAARSFHVNLPARAYGPEELAPVAIDVLQKKREKKYTIATPWLILGLTDMWGEYTASLSLLWRLRDQVEIDPFRKVIFQYEGSPLVLGEDARFVPNPKRRMPW